MGGNVASDRGRDCGLERPQLFGGPVDGPAHSSLAGAMHLIPPSRNIGVGTRGWPADGLPQFGDLAFQIGDLLVLFR
jgi:hypothetical protein